MLQLSMATTEAPNMARDREIRRAKAHREKMQQNESAINESAIAPVKIDDKIETRAQKQLAEAIAFATLAKSKTKDKKTIGDIVSLLFTNPVFPEPPIEGYWEDFPIEKQIEIFDRLKKTYKPAFQAKPQGLREVSKMIIDYHEGRNVLSMMRLQKFKLFVYDAERTSRPKPDWFIKNFVPICRFIAPFTEFTADELVQKCNDYIGIPGESIGKIYQNGDVINRTVNYLDKEKGKINVPQITVTQPFTKETVKMDENLSQSDNNDNLNENQEDLVDIVRREMEKHGWKPFVKAGLKEGHLLDILSRHEPGLDAFVYLCQALEVEPVELLVLIKRTKWNTKNGAE